jgi:hypothetical protein
MPSLVLEGLSVILPDGWLEHPNPGGPRELRAVADGQTGVLQLSRFPDEQQLWFQMQPDLGTVAQVLGTRMGFSDQAATKQGTCNTGRYGFAMFQGGRFAAMFLWVTLSDDAVWLWTWLGPDPTSAEAQGAVRVVLGASVA